MRRVCMLLAGGLVVVLGGGAAWYYWTREPRVPEGASVREIVCSECALPERQANSKSPMPAIPTGSGHPCLVLFEIPGSEPCRQAGEVVGQAVAKLDGGVDVVRVDTEEFPQAASVWHLTRVPTQVLVSPSGEELWRHEGTPTLDQVVAAMPSNVTYVSGTPSGH